MPIILIIFLIIISIILFISVSYLVCHNKLLVKYALLWFLLSFVLVILAIFPQISTYFSNLFGFEKTSNFVFFSLIGLLILLSLSFSITISNLNRKISQLTQSIAINEKEKK